MKKLLQLTAGVIGGFIGWYSAHELGFYFSDFNCIHFWILPLVHILALCLTLYSMLVSYRVRQVNPVWAWFSVAAAALFSLVVFWQLIATLIFSGCER